MTAVTTENDEAEVTSTSAEHRPSRAAARRAARAEMPGYKAAAELAESGALDGLFAQIDAGEIDLTGDGGFIPALIKHALERGLGAELTEHLGYEKHAPDAAAFPNSRNGTTPKTVATQVGDVNLAGTPSSSDSHGRRTAHFLSSHRESGRSSPRSVRGCRTKR